MIKHLAVTMAAAAAIAPSAAAASRGSFSLKRADAVIRHSVLRDWRGDHPAATPCRWRVRHRVAACQVTIAAAVIDGQAAETFALTYVVTRDGPCVLHTGWHTDAGRWNCFTGPLVAIPYSLT